MNRNQIQEEFVRRFRTQVAPSPLSTDAIERVESRFGIVLPESYRAFVLTHGAFLCSGMLEVIVDQNAELWDIHSFSSAEEIIDATSAYIDAGMRDGLVSFASDSMGNMFCFQKDELLKPSDDCSVWFFDHDFCEDRKIFDSFDSCLQAYLSLPNQK